MTQCQVPFFFFKWLQFSVYYAPLYIIVKYFDNVDSYKKPNLGCGVGVGEEKKKGCSGWKEWLISRVRRAKNNFSLAYKISMWRFPLLSILISLIPNTFYNIIKLGLLGDWPLGRTHSRGTEEHWGPMSFKKKTENTN